MTNLCPYYEAEEPYGGHSLQIDTMGRHRCPYCGSPMSKDEYVPPEDVNIIPEQKNIVDNDVSYPMWVCIPCLRNREITIQCIHV